LNKTLYNLKQASRVWYNTLANFLVTLGFQPVDTNASVFTKESIIIAIYIDDLLIASDSKTNINTLKNTLSDYFKISDLGACYFYLNIKIIRDRSRRTLRLSQETYLHKMLSDHNMENYYSIKTPIKTSSRLIPTKPGYKTDPVFRKIYQSAVSFFIYIMLGTRPDIAYTVSVISRFSANPTEAYINTIKRVFRYLKDILSIGLVFRGELQLFSGYTNSD
jgi:hypothetical protein